MRRFFTKHGLLVLSAAAAVMVILTLVTYFSNNTDALTNVVNVVASPFRSASAAVSGWVEGKIRFAEEYDALEEENAALKIRLAELEEELRQAREDSQENATLRTLLDLREQRRDFQLESARITEGDVSNWASTVTLDVGTDYGVEIGDCVITAEGYLVGSVTDAGTNWSTCTTLIDTQAAFGAKVFRTGTVAVAQGEFSRMGQGLLELQYLDGEAGVMAGDLIVTSGLGGYYPSELVIGYVREVMTGDDGLAQYAVLERAADLEDLRQVFVIKDFTIVE